MCSTALCCDELPFCRTVVPQALTSVLSCDSSEPRAGAGLAGRVRISDVTLLLEYLGGRRVDFASGFAENGWGQVLLPAEAHRKWLHLKWQHWQSFSGRFLVSWLLWKLNPLNLSPD